MITLRCIDPESTWPLELQAPGGGTVTLDVRHLSVRDYLRFREMRLAAVAATGDPAQIDGLVACIRFAVQRVRNGEVAISMDQLLELVTIDTLADIVYEIQGGQRLSGADLGKSGSARPFAAAPSAPDAGVESA